MIFTANLFWILCIITAFCIGGVYFGLKSNNDELGGTLFGVLLLVIFFGWGLIATVAHPYNESNWVEQGTVVSDEYGASIILEGKEFMHFAKANNPLQYDYLNHRKIVDIKCRKAQNLYGFWETCKEFKP